MTDYRPYSTPPGTNLLKAPSSGIRANPPPIPAPIPKPAPAPAPANSNSTLGNRRLSKSKSLNALAPTQAIRPRNGALLVQQPKGPGADSSSPRVQAKPAGIPVQIKRVPPPAGQPPPSSPSAPQLAPMPSMASSVASPQRPRTGRLPNPPIPIGSNITVGSPASSDGVATTQSALPLNVSSLATSPPSDQLGATSPRDKSQFSLPFIKSKRQRKGSSAPGPDRSINPMEFPPDFFKNEPIQVEYLEHRDRVAHEILTSEQSYNSYIKVFIHLFQKPLQREAQLGQLGGIKEETVKQLCGSMDAIFGASMFFMQEFAKRMTAWSAAQKIGDVFLKLGDLLKVYTIYTRDHEKATQILVELQDNKIFQETVARLTQNPNSGNRPLADFLIMPVQRVPRYELLLRDLIKSTQPTHVDYEDLCSALEKVRSIASQINESVEIRKRQLKMLSIQKLFTVSPNLIAPHREFLLEGEMIVGVDQGKKKLRRFWLFNDLLIYGSELMSSRYLLSYRFPLDTLIIMDVGDSDKWQFVFKIKTPVKTVAVAHQTREGKEQWMQAIKDAQSKLTERIPKSAMPAKPISPDEWMNDGAKECGLCSQAFGLVNRRHHCRACGVAACQACSPKNMPMLLPGMTEPSLQRVCITCWHSATAQQQSPTAK